VDEDALLKMGVKKVFCGSLPGDVAAYLNQYLADTVSGSVNQHCARRRE